MKLSKKSKYPKAHQNRHKKISMVVTRIYENALIYLLYAMYLKGPSFKTLSFGAFWVSQNAWVLSLAASGWFMCKKTFDLQSQQMCFEAKIFCEKGMERIMMT